MNPFRLYNTQTRRIEPVTPLDAGRIKMYSCGPTVYHYYHIGNLRNAVFVDTLKRALTASGMQVKHIMNITDVGHLSDDGDNGEDKLHSMATREGKSVYEVADFYTNAFYKDMDYLNVIPPQRYIKATSEVEAQLGMLHTLLGKGFAYRTEQAIYFDTTRLADYGKLTGQNLAEKAVGAREDVVTDPNKRDPSDFALWFFTVGKFSGHSMRWPSDWGEGFPGWHLECSAIIEKHLGLTIDIHTGGVDHIGTHHTNEIAQSEAAHDGAPLSRHWTHIEFLLVDGQKMSKSIGNTYRLEDVTNRGYESAALRLLYLQSHYRSQQNFTFAALDAASNLLQRLRIWSYGRFQQGATMMPDAEFELGKQTILTALANDLGTPEAIAALIRIVGCYEKENRAATEAQMTWVDTVFGLGLSAVSDISTDQLLSIKQREAARMSNDYEAADAARNRLKMQGIELEDTNFGPRWHKISNKS